jgi:hypothetical protein
MARQCPRDHDVIKRGEVADDTLANHLTRQAPDLAEDRAKQLEIKLEVAMAKNQSFGGEGDKSVREGGNRQDLADRQNRRCLIYRLVTTSAADSGGARQNRARRWRGDVAARESARKKTRASEGGATGRADQATWSGSTR